MSNIEIFKNEEFGEVRVLEINNEHWFVGKDIAKILGYKDVSSAILDHVDEEDRVNSKTQGCFAVELGQRGSWLINESGLYSLILSSKLPNAKKFKRWVTSEVLPTIRKHGAYMTDDVLEQAIENPDFMIGILQNLKKEKEKVKLLQNENTKLVEKIEEDKPKVTFATRVMNAKDSVSVTVLSKMISDEGFNISNRKLYDQLREWGYIYKRSRMPIQKYVEKGYFVVKTDTIDTPYGVKEVNNVKVTPKGQIHIVERILNENRIVA